MGNVAQIFGGVPADAGPGTDEISERVLDFAQKYDTPLVPEVYATWFAYFQRKNRGVIEQLDRAMNMSEPITEASLSELYHRHLSPRAMSDELEQIGTSLQNAVGEVSGAVEENLRDNSSFSGALRAARQSLVQGTSKRDVASIITHLHKVNQTQIAASQRVTMQLEKSRGQISKLEKELVEVKKAANTDFLTGLFNRRRLDELLEAAIFAARQRGSAMGLILCDIDNLRKVNETLGHSAGDNVLKIYARELRKQMARQEIPTRFTGAKFAIVLPEAGKDRAFEVAERVRISFSKIDWVGEQSKIEIGGLTSSFGVALLRSTDSKETLIERADSLLSQAKNQGRDQTVID
ncbi:MAG: GGDEF domain-containing protein [Pseudomonadota bacterium]